MQYINLLRRTAPTNILGKHFGAFLWGTNWSAQWHDVLHPWNMRVGHLSGASGIFGGSKKGMIP